MLKVVRLVLTTVLLLSFAACSREGEKQTNVAPTNSNNTAGTPATSPVAPTAATSPTAPLTATVKASNFKWTDDASGTPVTTIKVGGTVTWTNTDGNHSLERVAGNADNGCDSLDDSFDGELPEGEEVSRTFPTAGTFAYRCGVHKGTPSCKTPPGKGMSGIIKVVP